MKVSVLILSLFIFAACNQEEKIAAPSNPVAISNTTSSSVGSNAGTGQDDFSDLKKKDDEGCEDKTAEDVEKELEKKMAEMKKAQEQGKATGFNFNSGEPGCDPNAEGADAKKH
jgi:Skp family chaperone for outer membrane proteins